MNAETLDAHPWLVDERDFPAAGSPAEQSRFLLRYAILAPSSHNTQPWQFALAGDAIHVFADPSRWLRVADPDRRELYISAGCALENLLVAAEHVGFRPDVTYAPDPADETWVATVRLGERDEPEPRRPPELFAAIPARHTNHRVYEARPIPADHQARLQTCGDEDGLALYLTDDPRIRRQVDDLIVRADTIQFADPAWRAELGHWIGQGVFGTPWLLAKLGHLAVSYLNMSRGTAKQDSHILMSAPLLGILASRANDRTTQVRVGQVFERLCLTATSLDIRVQPMNQIVQLPELKGEVAGLLPVSDVVPQIPFRLGYAAPEERHTPRRPLAEVLRAPEGAAAPSGRVEPG